MAFNLSKNNDPVPVPGKKMNVWIITILLVVILSVLGWYLVPKREAVDTRPVVSSVTDTVSVPVVVPDPPRIAASFDKGTITPTTISDEIVNQITPKHKIIIYGYASSEGDMSVNLKLSTERAASFKQYLISKGIDKNRITVVGKGIDNPVATNETEEGRAQNRRVEVVFQKSL